MSFQTLTQLKASGNTAPAVNPANPATSKFQTLTQIAVAKQPAVAPTATPSATTPPTITQVKAGTVNPDQTIAGSKGLLGNLFPNTYDMLHAPVGKFDLRKAGEDAVNTIKSAFTDEWSRMQDYIKPNQTLPEKISSRTRVVSGAANVVFSPISAIFAGANNIPVLGQIAKVVTLPFSVAGEGATKISDTVIDKLPIDQKTKDTIKPGIGEIFALAAQLAVGKITEVGVKKMGELKAKYGAEDAATIVSKAEELAKEKTMSAKPAENENIGGGVVEQAQKGGQPIVGESGGVSAVKPAEIPENRVGKGGVVEVPREQLPVGGGEEKVSRLEARVKGVLENAPPDVVERLGLSTYETMNKADQIKAATDFVTKSPDKALSVLNGDLEAPPGILKNSIYVAMDNLAGENIGLATKLASLESTRMGQELSILTEINPDSAVKLMRDVIDVREKALQEKTGKSPAKAREEVVKSVKDEVKKTQPKVDDWKKFIQEIECGGT